MAAGAEPIDEKRACEEVATPTEVKPAWRGMVWVALLATVLFGVIYLSPLREQLNRVHELSQQVRSFGWSAPLVFTVSVAILVAVGLPRLFFCVVSGMAFGFWYGLLYAQLGTLLGNYLVFNLARSWARDWTRRYLSGHGRFHKLLQEEGMTGVILMRQLPVPGLLINLSCGFLTISRRDFVIGTVLGQLPEAIPCTLIGAGLLQASFQRSLSLISLGVGAAVLVWTALRWALRRGMGKD
jgi:uncharacterized membrane protein YdjX (TVP38/TMEM64 family)